MSPNIGLGVDVGIVLIILAAGWAGRRRGAVLLGMELLCFTAATAGALLFYAPLGDMVEKLFGTIPALSNLIAVTIIWILIEIGLALAIRFSLLKHLHQDLQLSWPNQLGGVVLNACKFAILTTLAIVIALALPIPVVAKSAIRESVLAQQLVSMGRVAQKEFAAGLSQDLGNSLNLFTLNITPTKTEYIELGFTTTGIASPYDESAMLVLVNNERTNQGLSVLSTNEPARVVARAYATRMFAEGFFSHNDSNGKGPFNRLDDAGVKYSAAGENLALASNLAEAHQGLMNSPGHRANILNENFRKVGIGIIDGGPYGLMVVQLFTD